jgi:hypothetical protein
MSEDNQSLASDEKSETISSSLKKKLNFKEYKSRKAEDSYIFQVNSETPSINTLELFIQK